MALELHTAFEVERDDPAFDGHFPGRPILPGVALVARAMEALQRATATQASDWSLESAKFASPVAPGTRLVMDHRGEAAGRVRFEIRAGERRVASGAFARRPGPAP
jgi:3-hydroxymyristoyl/3-hydroxydecanoyl-(acyl carrier protein) dehydratase